MPTVNTLLSKTNLEKLAFIGNHIQRFNTDRSFFEECINLLIKWKDSGRPIRVIVKGTTINYEMAIESLTYSEEDGTGDVYFSLELKEYKFIKVPTIKISSITLTTPTTTRAGNNTLCEQIQM